MNARSIQRQTHLQRLKNEDVPLPHTCLRCRTSSSKDTGTHTLHTDKSNWFSPILHWKSVQVLTQRCTQPASDTVFMVLLLIYLLLDLILTTSLFYVGFPPLLFVSSLQRDTPGGGRLDFRASCRRNISVHGIWVSSSPAQCLRQTFSSKQQRVVYNYTKRLFIYHNY